MANLRSVNTKFWEDSWIEELSPSEKLIFLYLITNSNANLAGIYEITIRRICFETGVDKQTVSKAFERFSKDKKAYFIENNYLFLPNWLKNQNLNDNMKKGVIRIINELPNSVKTKLLGKDYQSLLKDYQSLRNTLLKYEVLEGEIEEEITEEEEGKILSPKIPFETFWDLYDNKTNRKKCEPKWNGLSPDVQQKVIDTLPVFLAYKPFKEYIHPNPLTYLNNERWNDEIPKDKLNGTYQKSTSQSKGNRVESAITGLSARLEEADRIEGQR